MLFYITFKKEPLACGSQEGHMRVTSRLLCGSVGQQVWPTFNPDVNIPLKCCTLVYKHKLLTTTYEYIELLYIESFN